MKLCYSTTSPFVRKVHVLAIETGLIDRIELVKTVTTDPELGKLNPLNKVPALVLDDGSPLFQSSQKPVICRKGGMAGDKTMFAPPAALVLQPPAL